MSLKFAWCCLAQNRQAEIREAIRRVAGRVDHMIVVDGGSVDDSLFYLRGRGDVDVVLAPWRDDFSWSRNQYIERARALGCDWILVGDTDEWWSEFSMLNMRTLLSMHHDIGTHVVEFRDEAVTLMGDREVWRNTAGTFYKPLAYRLTPGFHYEGNPHHTPVWEPGIAPRLAKAPPEFSYSHTKQGYGAIAHRGARNFYIGNSNRFGARWREFRAKVNLWISPREWREHVGCHWTHFDATCSPCTSLVPWHDFERALMDLGQDDMSHPALRWILDHRHDDADEGDSECRETYLLAFRIYHPELDPFPNEIIKGQGCSLPGSEHP